MPKKIHFKVTEERTEILPMGVYRRLGGNDPEAQMYFVAHFMLDGPGGAYLLSYDEDGVYLEGLPRAWAVLDPLPLRDIVELVERLQSEAEETAVPKA